VWFSFYSNYPEQQRPTRWIYINDENFVSYFNNKEEKDRILFSAAVKEFMKYVKFREGLKVLDIGTGTGTFLRVARHFGWDVTGIWPNRNAANFASEKYNINIIQGALQHDTFPPETFDLITLFQTLEHMPNPMETVLICHNLVKKGGMVLVEVPNLHNLSFLLSKLLNIKGCAQTLDPTAHLYYFTSTTLERMILRANLYPIVRYAGFNKALIDVALRNDTDRKLLSYPYRVMCSLADIFRIGLALTVIAQKR